jgi:hypothetical protein
MSKNDSPFEIITEPEEQEVSEQKPNLLTRITDSFRISNIDKIVKIISFIVSIADLLAFIAVAVLLYFIDTIFLVVSVAILILGLVISLINLFILYGMGHILTQNGEIIELLKRK